MSARAGASELTLATSRSTTGAFKPPALSAPPELHPATEPAATRAATTTGAGHFAAARLTGFLRSSPVAMLFSLTAAGKRTAPSGGGGRDVASGQVSGQAPSPRSCPTPACA